MCACLKSFLKKVTITTPISIYKEYCFELSILMIQCLSWSTNMFSFFNHQISFIYAPNSRQSWLGITNIFCRISQWITFLNECYVSFHCFYRYLFHWSHISFPLSMPNHLLKSARTFNFKLICISTLLLVFALEIQIIRSLHNFFLNIRLFKNIFLYMA